MADSDVDSWYDWKQGDDVDETSTVKNEEISRDFELSESKNSVNQSVDVRGGSARVNGLVRRHTKLTSSRSGPEVRFINSAIYAESVDTEEDQVQIRVRVKSKDNEVRDFDGQVEQNCGDSTEMSDLMSTLYIKNDLSSTVGHAGDQTSSQDTYRCSTSPFTGSTVDPSSVRSKSVVSTRPTIERRCKIEESSTNCRDGLYSARLVEPEVQRYTLNGHRVVRVSTTSFSSTTMSGSQNGVDFARKIAHDEWIRKKQQAAQRKKEEDDLAERRKRQEIERMEREREERERKERESFSKWAERKKKEKEERRAAVEKELELQKRLKDIEDKAAVAKALCLRQWTRKKQEEQKARQQSLETRQRQIDEERKRRLEESSKAYEKWREMSKNKPKPATQGLLPHQNAKPTYVNPTPWQVVSENSDDGQVETSTSRKSKTSASKISSRKSVTSYQ